MLEVRNSSSWIGLNVNIPENDGGCEILIFDLKLESLFHSINFMPHLSIIFIAIAIWLKQFLTSGLESIECQWTCSTLWRHHLTLLVQRWQLRCQANQSPQQWSLELTCSEETKKDKSLSCYALLKLF